MEKGITGRILSPGKLTQCEEIKLNTAVLFVIEKPKDPLAHAGVSSSLFSLRARGIACVSTLF